MATPQDGHELIPWTRSGSEPETAVASSVSVAAEGPRDLRFGRSLYFWALLSYLLFVWYGSLVPLNFKPIAPREAAERFWTAIVSPLEIYSRTDFTANIVLFVQLAYFLMAFLRSDRRSRLIDVMVGVAVVPCLVLISMC